MNLVKNIKLEIDPDGWQRLIDLDTSEVIAEGHKLDAEDVLFGLGYRFEIEHVDGLE